MLLFWLCLTLCGLGLCGAQNGNPVYYQYPVEHPATADHQTSRSGIGFNGGFSVGDGNPIQPAANNGLLMTVIVGLGVISLLNLVTNLITPLLKKSNGSTPSNSTTTPSPQTPREMPNLDYLTERILSAVEALA